MESYAVAMLTRNACADPCEGSSRGQRSWSKDDSVLSKRATPGPSKRNKKDKHAREVAMTDHRQPSSRDIARGPNHKGRLTDCNQNDSDAATDLLFGPARRARAGAERGSSHHTFVRHRRDVACSYAPKKMKPPMVIQVTRAVRPLKSAV